MDHDLTFYTREDCALCEKALAAVSSAIELHGLSVAVTEVDVDGDETLRARFSDDVPVIFVDGVEAFRHRVTADEFYDYIRYVPKVAAHPSLADEACIPCHGGVPALKGDEIAMLVASLGGEWRVIGEHHLEKEFTFPDFAQALAFTNRVGAIAEAAGHHPDLYLAWGKVRVTIWTHKVDGLTRADFVLAAKIDR